jgi:DNA-binding winged helix-turn-helix (wHTH) protein/pimeloyl-ACP methyl ester carboxylesterase
MQFTFLPYIMDTESFELTKAGKRVEIEPQVFELLCLLIRNADRVVSHEELFETVWNGRIVSLSTLTSRINAARSAIGDDGAKQALIKTIPRRGYRFVGKALEVDAAPPHPQPPRPQLSQEIRFCTSQDGVRLAYASSGNGPLLLKAANWMSHLEFEWQSPVWGHWIDALSDRYQLVRYDGRGNGLSDRFLKDISFEAMLADLETIADATGMPRFPLLGIGQGCATAIAYAVRHPDRVSHLILYGGYIRGWRARGDLREIAWRTALGTLIREGWGKETNAFRQVFTSMFLPGGNPDQMEWYNELQRMTVDPDVALMLHEAFGDFDVSALLPKVRTPTLVIHARDDVVCPFNAGLALAAGIPGARFVALDSINHILLPHEKAFARALDEIRAFAAPHRELRAGSNL